MLDNPVNFVRPVQFSKLPPFTKVVKLLPAFTSVILVQPLKDDPRDESPICITFGKSITPDKFVSSRLSPPIYCILFKFIEERFVHPTKAQVFSLTTLDGRVIELIEDDASPPSP